VVVVVQAVNTLVSVGYSSAICNTSGSVIIISIFCTVALLRYWKHSKVILLLANWRPAAKFLVSSVNFLRIVTGPSAVWPTAGQLDHTLTRRTAGFVGHIYTSGHVVIVVSINRRAGRIAAAPSLRSLCLFRLKIGRLDIFMIQQLVVG
jgi:hypothetical protein